jgi:phage-related protein
MSNITANEDGLKPKKREVKQVNKQSIKELKRCPEAVRDAILFQLNERVAWGKSPMQSVDPKKVRGDVMQMSFPDNGNTYRALYSTKDGKVVLLLVVFQKKTNGSANEQYDLAETRLKRWRA